MPTRYVSYDSIAECFEHVHEKKESEVLEEIALTLSNKFIEIVHCEECIYYKEKGYDSRPYCYYFDEPWSPSRGISREPDDFCSRGEKGRRVR